MKYVFLLLSISGSMAYSMELTIPPQRPKKQSLACRFKSPKCLSSSISKDLCTVEICGYCLSYYESYLESPHIKNCATEECNKFLTTSPDTYNYIVRLCKHCATGFGWHFKRPITDQF